MWSYELEDGTPIRVWYEKRCWKCGAGDIYSHRPPIMSDQQVKYRCTQCDNKKLSPDIEIPYFNYRG